MPRIVYLCEYGTIYGGENSMLSGLCAVQSRGFDVAVVCPPDTALSAQLSQLGIAQIPFTWVDSTGKRKPLELLRNELAKTIPAWQADIVHANSLSVSRILGPIQRTVDVKFVGHLRDIIKLNKRVIADISMLDEIYCVSTATRDFHVAQGMAIGKSCVLHNGVDLKEFAPSKEPVESDVLRLVYIGQLVIRKGIDVLLDGVRLAIEHGANVSLDLYGERHSIKEEAQKYEADLYRFVEANRLEPHIHFRGRTDNTPEILRQSDVLVHAARQEPWGRVLLEAAATGLPIIATQVGGTNEMFPGGEAILVPVDDPFAIAKSIGELYRSPELRQLLGRNARQRIERFGIDDYADKLTDRYRKVLGRTPK